MATVVPPAPAPSPGPSPGIRCAIITGLSGAGMTTVLKALEDVGYTAVDNLPLSLLPPLLDQVPAIGGPLAVVVDSRTFGFTVDAMTQAVAAARARPGLQVELAFIDCAGARLLTRFTETRRRHPMAQDRPVSEGIAAEQVLLAPIRAQADHLIDTSDLAIHDLRRLVVGRFGLAASPGLTITVVSFGFRRGLPRDADLVFDVRFLNNPHWDLALRPLTGLDPAVQAAIRGDPGFQRFVDSLTALIEPLLPRYEQEGKSYLTIAIGCTGGKHRSVFVAETLVSWLQSRNHRTTIVHRDVPTQRAAERAAEPRA